MMRISTKMELKLNNFDEKALLEEESSENDLLEEELLSQSVT